MPPAKRSSKAKPATKAASAKRATGKPAAKAPGPKAAGKRATAEAASAKKGTKPAAEKAAAPKGPKYPGAHVRMRVPIAAYEAAKDAFKAPVKAQGLAWQYLGPGQGRYFDEKVAIFVKFGDNVDYSLRGDEKRVGEIVAAWRALGAADVTEKAKAEDESDALRAWKLEEPVRRAGEPDGFYNRRRAEWEARKPA